MRGRIALAALLVISMPLLAGCTAENDTDSTDASADVADTGEVTVERIIIEEDEVVCYYYRDGGINAGDGGAGGLSCLPFSEVAGVP